MHHGPLPPAQFSVVRCKFFVADGSDCILCDQQKQRIMPSVALPVNRGGRHLARPTMPHPSPEAERWRGTCRQSHSLTPSGTGSVSSGVSGMAGSVRSDTRRCDRAGVSCTTVECIDSMAAARWLVCSCPYLSPCCEPNRTQVPVSSDVHNGDIHSIQVDKRYHTSMFV
jgi:hypothetical protein